MKAIQTKSGKILLVKIPEDTSWWRIDINNLGDYLTKELNLNQQFLSYGKSSIILSEKVNNIVFANPDNFFLPEGNWEIFGKFSELEDNDLEEFVEGKRFNEDYAALVYKDYLLKENNVRNYFISAKSSFESLCKSQGIEDNLDNYLIIKTS